MQKQENAPDTKLFWILCSVLILAIGCLGYLWYTLENTKDNLTAQTTAYNDLQATTTTALTRANDTISELTEQLAQTEDELDETKDDLRDAEREIEDFEDEYRATIDAVKDLNKLSQIDEELLQQYSRVSFLNENYIPRKLTQIDDEYIVPGREDEYFLADAWPFLEDLLEDAARDDIELLTLSAYRSFDEQATIKGRYLQVYGEGANTFSADQGFSEHQLGTAVDFSTPALSGQLAGFGDTEAYQWLLDNAYKHGFILSYPEGNEFYIFEPWHWRFVGEDLARDLNRDDRGFYDVPQRELDEYRLEIFD